MSAPTCFSCDTETNLHRSITGRMVCDRCEADMANHRGVSFAEMLTDIQRTQARTLSNYERADGRVRSPHHFPSSPHDN
jgi:ribosomal protein L37AE/L43A